MPADPGGCQVELRGELGGGDRAGGRDELQHALAGAGVGVGRDGRRGAVDRRAASRSCHTSVGSGPVVGGRARDAHTEGRDIGNILVANIHPRKQGEPSPGVASLTQVSGRRRALDFPLVPDSPALEISGLVKRYGGRAVVDGLDLVAQHGQVTAVLGPNGAGKTTTVECCEGLREPDGGTVRVLGPRPGRARARRCVPASASCCRTAACRRASRPHEMLAHVARMYADPRDLGELDRAPRPRVVRRAPPSGGCPAASASGSRWPPPSSAGPRSCSSTSPAPGMDPQSRHAVWDLVRELRDEGVAVVLTTHLMDEAEDLADQVVVVDHGRVIAQGSVPSLVVVRRATGPCGSRPTPGLDLHAALGAGLAVDRAARRVRTRSTGAVDPDDGRRAHRLARRAGRAGHAADRRPPHARGRLPRPDRTEPAMTRHRCAARAARVLAQTSFEARAILRNGEQLLVTIIVPVLVLVGLTKATGIELDTGGASRIDFLTPGVLALAVMTTSFTSQAIASSLRPPQRRAPAARRPRRSAAAGCSRARCSASSASRSCRSSSSARPRCCSAGARTRPASPLARRRDRPRHRGVHVARAARRGHPARRGGARRREPAAARARGRRRRHRPGRAGCPGRWRTSRCCCRPARSARRCARRSSTASCRRGRSSSSSAGPPRSGWGASRLFRWH